MLNPKRWHMLHAKQFCSLDATVACQNLVVAVDQNRVRKSELVNRAGDLFNLLSGVGSGVIWVRSKVATRRDTIFRSSRSFSFGFGIGAPSRP